MCYFDGNFYENFDGIFYGNFDGNFNGYCVETKGILNEILMGILVGI